MNEWWSGFLTGLFFSLVVGVVTLLVVTAAYLLTVV